MLKRITIENIYGIKGTVNLDFSQKYINKNKLDNTLLIDGKESIMLTPVLISKNATGKTSILRAIKLAHDFMNHGIDAWKINYKTRNFFFRKMLRVFNDNVSDVPLLERDVREFLEEHLFINKDITDEAQIMQAVWDGMTELLERIEETDHDIALKYENVVNDFDNGGKISAEFSDGRNVKVEISAVGIKINGVEHDFYEKVVSDNQKFIFSYMDSLKNGNANNPYFESLKPMKYLRNEKIKDNRGAEVIERLTFIEAGQHQVSTLRGGVILKSLINNFGFDFAETLLRKMDSNVSTLVSLDGGVVIKAKEWGEIQYIDYKNLSSGTRKVIEIFSYSACSLRNGGVVMIDEIENGLNLSLINLIISAFKDKEINVGGCQLIFTTHTPLLMSTKIVNPKQVFVYDGKNFKNIVSIASRTENIDSMFLAKNYFTPFSNVLQKLNDFEFGAFDSISTTSIDEILDKAVING